jgi:hypothetical protein
MKTKVGIESPGLKRPGNRLNPYSCNLNGVTIKEQVNKATPVCCDAFASYSVMPMASINFIRHLQSLSCRFLSKNITKQRTFGLEM